MPVQDDDEPRYEVVDPAGRRSAGGSVAELRRLLPTRRRALDDGPAFTLVGEHGVSLAVGADRVTLITEYAERRHVDGLGDDRLARLWLDLLDGGTGAERAVEALEWRVDERDDSTKAEVQVRTNDG